MADLSGERIASVEWVQIEGARPRVAGSNARLGEHGRHVRRVLARLTTTSGASGMGPCQVTEEHAQLILGSRLDRLFSLQHGSMNEGMPLDFALWDLVGVLTGRSVYELAAQMRGRTAPPRQQVACYDTSLYIDDLHIADNHEAAALIAAEATEGFSRGHRAFKIKVGRGARHMSLAKGTERDIDVIRAVRSAVGDTATLMIDANNGYNLNLAKQVLAETADCRIFWLEEPFHEDAVLYQDLRAWLDAEGLDTLIADGEGQASPSLLTWAERGLVDVIQYDIFGYGFTNWLGLGRQLDAWGVMSAPHHYGGYFGNFMTGHLAASIDRFALVEWDEATVPEIETSAYTVRDGFVELPNKPGFGLALNERHFEETVTHRGHRVNANR